MGAATIQERPLLARVRYLLSKDRYLQSINLVSSCVKTIKQAECCHILVPIRDVELPNGLGGPGPLHFFDQTKVENTLAPQCFGGKGPN